MKTVTFLNANPIRVAYAELNTAFIYSVKYSSTLDGVLNCNRIPLVRVMDVGVWYG